MSNDAPMSNNAAVTEDHPLFVGGSTARDYPDSCHATPDGAMRDPGGPAAVHLQHRESMADGVDGGADFRGISEPLHNEPGQGVVAPLRQLDASVRRR
jgi:hypothetical protein